MFELIATTAFGLEAVVKREIQNLGYSIKSTEDGKITFSGDVRALIHLIYVLEVLIGFILN